MEVRRRPDHRNSLIGLSCYESEIHDGPNVHRFSSAGSVYSKPPKHGVSSGIDAILKNGLD